MTLNLGVCVADQARRRPDAIAISTSEVSVSWSQLQDRSSRLAGALQSLGVNAGDRIGLLMKNDPVFHEVLFACNKIGAVAVGLNWRLSPRELREIIVDSSPRVVFVDSESKSLLGELDGATVPEKVMVIGEEYDEWIKDHALTPEMTTVDTDASALILYSSGTTGKAKGITLTNENLSFLHNMATELFHMQSDSVYLLGSPLFHIGGVGTGSALMTLGGRTVLLSDSDPDVILDTIEREHVTHTFFVPAVIQQLVDAQQRLPRDLSSLQLLAYGAAPMTDTLLRKAIEVLGCGFLGCYGMTETAGTVTALFPEEHEPDGPAAKVLLSVGRPLPWVEIKLVDPVSGRDIGSDEFGEIWIRSKAITPGYFNNEEATKSALVDGGWLRTGDGATVDDEGYIYLKDRIKDMIISGGENVYPVEVENVLAQHPAVAEAAVIGVPSERWGETVFAVIVLREGMDASPADIIEFSRARLAHYKCPTKVSMVGALPRNATGKVLKTELRTRFR